MTYTLADRAAAEGHPVLEVRRVALHDGSHASLILKNGRISKLVAPSGQVARLHWEEDTPSPREPLTAMCHQPESQTERYWDSQHGSLRACTTPVLEYTRIFFDAAGFHEARRWVGGLF